jgi:hypothetical protein
VLKCLVIVLVLLSPISVCAEVVETAPVLDTCPKTVSEWKKAREKLWSARALAEVLAFGELVSRCKSQPEQKRLFKSSKLQRCLHPLEEFAALTVERSDKKNPLLRLIPTGLPKDAYYLPKAFQNEKFWQDFSSPDEARSDAAVLELESRIPGSVTFRYRSEFQPNADLYLTVYQPSPKMTRMVHYGKDLSVNLLTLYRESGRSQPKALLSNTELSHVALEDKTDTSEGRCTDAIKRPFLRSSPVRLIR